jgi:hypothetical protein
MSVIQPPQVDAAENTIGSEKREQKLSAFSDQLSAPPPTHWTQTFCGKLMIVCEKLIAES